jgi:hypothetical protein
MKPVRRYSVAGCTAVLLAATVPAGAGTAKCLPDSVKVGSRACTNPGRRLL